MKRIILTILMLLIPLSLFSMGEDPKSVSEDKPGCPLEITSVYVGDDMDKDYTTVGITYKNISDKAIKGAHIRCKFFDGNDDIISWGGQKLWYIKFHGENCKTGGQMHGYFEFPLISGTHSMKAKVTKVYFIDGTKKNF
ncbi:hypothetical protein ACFL56_00890 [Candidatus Margulisiibacteriota bacterium]